METKILKILILFLFYYTSVNAQKITDSIEYGIENDYRENGRNVINKMKDFTRQMVEETILLKIGFDDFTKTKFKPSKDIDVQLFSLKFGLGIEQKIFTDWSVLADWRTVFEDYSYTWDSYSPGFIRSQGSLFYTQRYDTSEMHSIHRFNLNEFSLGVKHYFNLKKRIATGESANNLSGSYVLFKYTQRVFFKGKEIFDRNNENNVFGKMVFCIGMQRRLSRFGFFDINVGSGFYFYNNKFDIDVNHIPMDRRISFSPFTFSFTIGFGL